MSSTLTNHHKPPHRAAKGNLNIMAYPKCPDCGEYVDSSLDTCPECGCPIDHSAPQTAQPITPHSDTPAAQSASYCTKTDWAQYFYECGVIGWKAFKKYCSFTGRASRREFWSFNLICLMVGGFTGGLAAFICLLPMLGVSIRRMHDTNHCGWWCICPIACFFLFLKRSDVGENRYGYPNPATNYLD